MSETLKNNQNEIMEVKDGENENYIIKKEIDQSTGDFTDDKELFNILTSPDIQSIADAELPLTIDSPKILILNNTLNTGEVIRTVIIKDADDNIFKSSSKTLCGALSTLLMTFNDISNEVIKIDKVVNKQNRVCYKVTLI